jgi:pimeloyl-ACP methyl ester carboxylesterase
MDEPHEACPLPENCDESYVVANGVRLHYVASGRGPLTILLHGFPKFWSFEVLRLLSLVWCGSWLSALPCFSFFRLSYPGSVVK